MLQERTKRYQVIVTPKTLKKLERERGAVPISTYITEVLRKWAEVEEKEREV